MEGKELGERAWKGKVRSWGCEEGTQNAWLPPQALLICWALSQRRFEGPDSGWGDPLRGLEPATTKQAFWRLQGPLTCSLLS